MTARLPTPGSDDGTWGTILNDFLSTSLNADGTLNSVAVTNAGAVTSVNAQLPSSGQVTLSAANVGALSATATAGGDLSGNFPNPAVAAINGIAISGTPISGQVLTATGTSAAGWSPAAASGGPTDWINIKSYGAKGDGATDDTAAIQAAINACIIGGTVYFPASATPYIVTGLSLKPGCAYIGNMPTKFASSPTTLIQLKSGANPLAVMASSGALANGTSPFSDFGVRIENLVIDGNSANNTTGYGILLMTFRSIVRNVQVQNTAQDAFVLTDKNAGGNTLQNTAVENRFEDCRVNTVGGRGFWIQDNGTSALTDGYLMNCLVNTPGTTYEAVRVERAAGWHIESNHVYGCMADAFYLNNCWNTWLVNNQMDKFGMAGAASTTYHGYNINIIPDNHPTSNGRGLICIGNQASTDESVGTASTIYDYFYIRMQSSPGTGYVNFSGNVMHQDVAGTGTSSALVFVPNGSTINIHYSGNQNYGTTIPQFSTSVNFIESSSSTPVPSDYNTGASLLQAWCDSPGTAGGSSTPSAGVLQLTKVYVRRTVNVSKAYLNVTTAGSGAQSLVNCFVGIYTSAGTLVTNSASADQSASWASNGSKTISLGATVTLTPGFYWVGIVVGTQATTSVVLRSFSAGQVNIPNIGLSAAYYAMATNGAGLSALPSSITPSSNGAANPTAWVAIG